MLVVADKIKEILELDEIALEAISEDILNFRAYAKKIQKEVESRCKKPIKLSTIVVSLTRLAKKIKLKSKLRPQIHIENLVIKSPLIELTFKKTEKSLENLSKIKLSENDFFTITHGIDEVTVVCSDKISEDVRGCFIEAPKAIINELIAISLRFPDEYFDTPNVIYSLISPIALKRVNVIEVISTYTELTFILKKDDMHIAMQAFEQFIA